MSRRFRPFVDVNGDLDREERKQNAIAFCVGLFGFLIVLALVGTFLYELALAVAGK